MSHKVMMQHSIYLAMKAMPSRMRPNDMALLFANFLITHELEDDLADIGAEVVKMIEMYVDDPGENDVETITAITDADQFLARIQAGKQA